MPEPVECAYSVEGTGPALFLIDGVGARGSAWSGVVDRMKSRFTCVTYDLRGHGGSPGTPPFGLDELVADLEALRAKLGIEKAHVAGHSLGGMVAAAYARAHPSHVASVALLSTAAFRAAEDSERIRGVAASLRENGVAPVIDGFVSRWFTEDFQRRHPDRVEARKRQVLATDERVFIEVFRIYAETEMGPWLHEVTAQALVLTGEHDLTCTPALNERIARALLNSQLAILKNLKHGLVIEAPDQLATHLRALMRSENRRRPILWLELRTGAVRVVRKPMLRRRMSIGAQTLRAD